MSDERYQAGLLQVRNYIPANHARRLAAVNAAGGFQPHGSNDFEDWSLLRRMELAGATFKNVPDITWCYRFGLCDQLTY